MKDSDAGGDVLEQLLGNRWIDPDDGGAVGFPDLAVVMAPTLAGCEADGVAALALGKRYAVVCDRNTHAVLGERVHKALSKLGAAEAIVLDDPHADAATAAMLRRACAAADALVAVGSGTLNDLCKFAAAADSKPYVVFATAPSMNGYTSANAAITVDGHKQSLPAALPRGVFIDLEVFARAPARLIRAGVGDSICRPTAQADWLLSSHVLGTPYRRAPFVLLAPDEAGWLAAPEALLRGDRVAMKALARTLLLSGLGMTLCGGSHPASQGEHLVSHFVDMFSPPGRAACLHGEQVAVATLTMARIQEALLDGPPPRVAPSSMTLATLQERFGFSVGASCWEAFATKRLDDLQAEAQNARLAAHWEAIRDAIRPILIPAARLRETLRRIGAPASPVDIGLSDDFHANAVRNARFIRDRYTFLDLADDAGRLAALARA